MKRINKIILQIVLVIVVLIVGIIIARIMIGMKKAPEKKELTITAPYVNAEKVQLKDLQMKVTGFGTVNPKIQVDIVPQVSGNIVEISENMANGGFFSKNELLIGIDPRDYELAVESAEAEVARSKVMLDTELAEAKVARQEWKQLNPGKKPASELVFRKPQIRQAKAALRAAQATLSTAKLQLERTRITMPFNGRVSQESVDLGQYVSPGRSLASVYSTDIVEIVIPLEDRDLKWFEVPMTAGDLSKSGSDVIVYADFGGERHSWPGTIVRMEGQVDSDSRVVNVVVEVREPFKRENGRPPLVPGMFVEAEIQGKLLENIIRVPRHATHNLNEVWKVNDTRLHITKVDVIRRDKKYAYIQSGLDDGDVIVISPLDVVTDKMKIRTNLIENQPQTEGDL